MCLQGWVGVVRAALAVVVMAVRSGRHISTAKELLSLLAMAVLHTIH